MNYYRIFIFIFVLEYDYEGEYTLPSNVPPPLQEPPGAFSKASVPEKFSWCLVLWILSMGLR